MSKAQLTQKWQVLKAPTEKKCAIHLIKQIFFQPRPLTIFESVELGLKVTYAPDFLLYFETFPLQGWLDILSMVA